MNLENVLLLVSLTILFRTELTETARGTTTMDVSATPHHAASVSRRRWLPHMRFSLRTLVLTVLLIGSGGTLWWNWGPWGVAFTVEESNVIHDASFSDDAHYLLIHYDDLMGGKKADNCVDVRNASNGTRHALFRAAHGVDGSMSARGDYVLLSANPGSYFNRRPSIPPSLVFSLKTSGVLDSKGKLDEWTDCLLGNSAMKLYQLPPSPIEVNGETIYQKSTCSIVRLPSYDEVRNLGEFGGGFFAADGCFVHHDGERVHLFDPQSGHDIADVPAPSGGWGSNEPMIGDYFCWLLKDDTLSIVNVRTGIRCTPLKFSHLSDVSKDGKRIWIAEGEQKQIWVEEDHTTALYDFGSKLEHPIVRLPTSYISVSDDESLLFGSGKVYDGKSFRLLWESELSFQKIDTRNQLLVCENDDDKQIIDARNGRVLMDFASWRWRLTALDASKISFSHDASMLLVGRGSRITVFRLRRPWEWYGPAWLPEFWLTVIFGAAWIWSIWRDSRGFEHTDARG